MVRTARADVGGVCYHVLNRGNDRRTVFRSDGDYALFLSLADRAARMHATHLFAYCLMPNHFHFVVRTAVDGALGRWMHWLLTMYAQWHHKQYETVGHVWQGRFKAFPVEDDRYLLTVVRYVERNPLRAGLVERAEQWRWSSLFERIAGMERRCLTELPCPMPLDWRACVNRAESQDELRAIRQCSATERPFGSAAWVERGVTELGFRPSARGRGRPRK